MSKTIQYGFGLDYLPKWKTKQALREIYQNFIDYGTYSETKQSDKNMINVTITNSYNPENLEFLRIGNSNKGNNREAIGKHGEGIKMAFLVFLREGNNIKITTKNYILIPSLHKSEEIGDCFSIEYTKNNEVTDGFKVEFSCNEEDFNSFYSGVLKKEDYIHTKDNVGSIIDKKIGNIYSGGLFVCNLPNYTKAYEILPSNLVLDRDREVPKSFEVSWYSSKINESYDKWEFEHLGKADVAYIDVIPERLHKEIEPIEVEGTVHYSFKDSNNETKIITNDNLVNKLNNDSRFSQIIKKLKLYITKKLGLYELLIDFQSKHIHSNEAKKDFEIILNRIKK